MWMMVSRELTYCKSNALTHMRKHITICPFSAMYFWLLILLVILHFIKDSVVVVMPIVTGGSDDGDEGDGADGGGQGESLGSPSSSNQPGKPNRKPVRLTRKKHRALANKPQDFQVLFEF